MSLSKEERERLEKLKKALEDILNKDKKETPEQDSMDNGYGWSGERREW